MAEYLTNTTDLTTVADAIRDKGGTSAPLAFPDGFAEAIETIPTGITPSGKLNITDTAEKDVTNYATAQVVDANLVAANIKEGVTVLGITGTHEGGGITPTGTKSITANGTYDVTQFASAAVNVQPSLTTKTVTANGTYTPSSSYVGFSSVTVAIPTYDGTVV